MVSAHKEPPAKSAVKTKPAVRLERVGDWTAAEACLDVASYRSEHADLSKLNDRQVRGRVVSL